LNEQFLVELIVD